MSWDDPFASLFRQAESGSQFPPVVEHYDRGKTIFFRAIRRCAFIFSSAARSNSRVYEHGEEITVALLRENSVFGVLSLITGHRSDRFYHAVAFTPVDLIAVGVEQMERIIQEDPDISRLLFQGLASRILQTEMMIETLAHRDMGSRLESFLLILCRDFGLPTKEGVTIDLRLSHQAIAEAIGSTRVTITRLLGDLRKKKLISISKKRITVHDPIKLGQRFA